MSRRSGTILVTGNGIYDDFYSDIILPEAKEWFDWLDSNTSFHFDNWRGSFTANKDKLGYWTASKKVNCKLKRKRLGLSSTITLDKLRDTCSLLNNSRDRLAMSDTESLKKEIKELLGILVKANTRIWELEKELEQIKGE